MIKALAAFDKCKDSLAAPDLCSLTKKTLESSSNELQVEMVPMTDGGEGFVDILTQGALGEFESFLVSDSLGIKKKVPIGICEIGRLSQVARHCLNLPKEGKIGVIEMARIVGLADLSFEDRNAWKTCTRGVGELLAACTDLEVEAIVLGIGGSSTNDMGLGALAGLGLEIKGEDEEIISFPVPETWPSISKINSDKMLRLPPLFIACDVKNPLLGPSGATFQFGEQKGLGLSDREKLEKKMLEMVSLLHETFANAKQLASKEGSGAAGGIAFGLSLAYEVTIVPGYELVSSWFDLERKIGNCDLLITGEGKFDRTSMLGKAPFELIKRASELGKDAHLFAGSVDREARELCKHEYPCVEIHEFGNREIDLKQNLLNSEKFLTQKLKEVFDF